LALADTARKPVGTAAPADPATAKHIERAEQLAAKGLEFLKSKQNPDGGWQAEGEPTGMTAIVLKAFVQDGRYDANTDFVKRGYDRLLNYQVEDGGIYKDLLANYNTAIAVSALAAAENPAFAKHIEKAVNYLKGLQWTEMTTSAEGEKIAGEGDAWYGGWGYGGRSRGGGRPDLSNVQMALDARRSRSTAYRLAMLARLPCQLPMIRTAYRAARR
jgi:hypothetical protein